MHENIAKIVSSYAASRPNKDKVHPKIAVLFLACSGAGKSTITQKIVEELGATYLRNDDARTLLDGQEVSPKHVIDATWGKIKRESKNQFVVFDSSMSNYYMHQDSYYNVARREGYKIFIIAIDVPKYELERRIKNRQRHDIQEVLSLLPAQLEAQKKAIKELHPNFTVTPDTDYQEVVDAMRQFLAQSDKA